MWATGPFVNRNMRNTPNVKLVSESNVLTKQKHDHQVYRVKFERYEYNQNTKLLESISKSKNPIDKKIEDFFIVLIKIKNQCERMVVQYNPMIKEMKELYQIIINGYKGGVEFYNKNLKSI